MEPNKKKIVIIGPAWPYRGGLAVYNERLAREFSDGGHNVTVVTFTLQYPKILFPGKTQYSDAPAPDGITITREINAINPLNWIRAGFALRRRKADLVIVRYWLPFMAPSLGTVVRIARSRQTRIVSLVDNIIPHEKRIGDKLFSRYFMGAVDGFLVMSEAVRNELLGFGTSKPIVQSPHPLFDNFGDPVEKSQARKHLGLEDDGKFALFFGFIRDYKGLDLAIKAFARSPLKEQDHIKLIIAGEFYSNSTFYTELIQELGLEQRMILHSDFISDDQVRYYFAAADLVVQPYRSATQSGISQIAYHFSKPMVVTRVGGLPEIVPHGKAGFVVDVNEVAIAEAIHRFFNESMEESFRKGIEAEKAKYSWPRLVESFERLYDQL